MHIRMLSRLVAASLVCGLVLSGCSGDESSDDQADMPDLSSDDQADMSDLSSDDQDMDQQPDVSMPSRCDVDEAVQDNVCVPCQAGASNDAGDDPGGPDTSCEITLCGEDEYVQANVCVTCSPGTTNEAGDDASGTDTSCDPTLCGEDERVEANVCEVCAPGSTNEAGDDASGADTLCDPTLCGENEFVQGNVCVVCPVGSSNDAGDDASGADTQCDATLCMEDERVEANACVSCPAGTTNEAGDDVSGSDTSCDVTLCNENERVQANMCVACAPGTTNEANDVASGANTLCQATRCGQDERVQGHVCVSCLRGSENMPGDDASGADTMCDGILCPSDTRVEGNVCVVCAAGTTNEAGDDASGADTMCDATLCLEDERVDANVCVACSPGTTNEAGDDASGADTVCDPTICSENERVQGNVCVACGPGTTNEAGDDASGADTLCDPTLCGEDEFVQNNTCVACAPGTINEANDDASGSDTMCEAVFCKADEFVQNNLCVACAPGTTNAADDDARGADTMCEDACIPVLGKTCAQLQTDYLKASHPDADDSFGTSLSLSGNTLVIGAPSESSGDPADPSDNSVKNSGAAYVFVRDTTTGAWAQQAYLKASNLEMDDLFGWSVSISGDTIVVGALREDSGDPANPADGSVVNSGAAYVFVRDTTTNTWSEQAYLKASNLEMDDLFGWTVDIDGDTIVVGAAHEDSSDRANPANNSASNSGAAYVFVRDTTGTWSEQAYLKASNANVSDEFGKSLAISGDTIVVGAYSEDSGDPTNPADNSAQTSGAAYVFVRDTTTGTWNEQAYLKASNAEAGDHFGWSVDILEDTLIVGAVSESGGDPYNPADNSASYSGAAYVFVRDTTTGTWSEQAYLKASNLDGFDAFGQSVALSEDTLVVGAHMESGGDPSDPTDDSAAASGAAYVFVRDATTGAWSRQAYLKAFNLDPFDSFGWVVAISGGLVVVSGFDEASDDPSNPNDNSALFTGAVYVIE